MTLTEMSDFLTSQESAFSKQITEAQESFANLNGLLKDLPKKQAEKIKEEQEKFNQKQQVVFDGIDKIRRNLHNVIEQMAAHEQDQAGMIGKCTPSKYVNRLN